MISTRCGPQTENEIRTSHPLQPSGRRDNELPLAGVFVTLSALYLYFCLRELWIEDYWIHAAIARELVQSLFAPSPPLIVGGSTDVPYWPYLAAVALVSRATGLSTYVTLAGFGFVNLFFLLFALRLFVLELTTQRTAAFLSVAAILLLWGPHPWLISGFLHVDVFFYVLPYPSTFAEAATFLCLALYSRYLSRPRTRTILAVAALSLLVVLVHSLTALFLFAGLGALVFWKRGFSAPRSYVETAAVILVSVGVASIWPYFPLLEVAGESRYAAALDTHPLYERVWQRTWPLLLAVPFFGWRLVRNWRDPLVTGSIVVSSLYVLGALTEHWSYGRVLPYVAMLLQIGVGVGIAELVATMTQTRVDRRATGAIYLVLSAATCALVVGRFSDAYTERGPVSNPYHLLQADRTRPIAKFAPLAPLVKPGTVTLADLNDSLMLPAFGAKVVALERPSFFKDDYDERMEAVEAFFEPTTSPSARVDTLTRYAVTYVLVDKETPETGVTRQTMEDLGGRVVVDTPALTLLEMPRGSGTR